MRPIYSCTITNNQFLSVKFNSSDDPVGHIYHSALGLQASAVWAL